MKPSFALNFTDDSVALLHRAKRGWLEIGRSTYDTPDLAEAMAYLRATALGLSPQGVATKLVIPASQIRYFRIEAPGPSETARRTQIAAALEGRTAYTVDELAFDWSGSGSTVDVAVVARETLAEAEAFALQHRFSPVSLVALPEDGTFAGEPWFGPTAHAASLLAQGEAVDRDSDSITILSRSLARSDAPVVALPTDLAEIDPPQEIPPAPEPAPFDPAPEPEPVVDPEPLPDPAPRPLPDPVIEPEPLPEPDPVPEPLPATVPPPAPEGPAPAPVELPVPTPAPEPAEDVPPPAEMPAYDPIDEPVTMAGGLRPAAVLAAPSDAIQAPTPIDPDEAPIALDVEDDDIATAAAFRPVPAPAAGPANAKVTENSLTVDDDEPTPSATTFTSRRVPALAGATAAAAQNMARRLGAASRDAASSAAPAAKRAPKFGFADPADALRPAPSTAAKAPPPLTAPLAAQAAADGPAPVAAKAAVPPAPRPQAARPTAAAAPAARTTANRGPRSLTAPPRGKPRHLGLVLTGLLLVALALAAALSSYYAASVDNPEATALASATANATDPQPVPQDPSTAPSVDDEMAADGQDIDADAAAAPAPPAETAADASAAPGVAAPAPAPETATGPAPIAPDTAPPMQTAGNGNDEIYLSAADTVPTAIDAAALPLPEARTDPAPTAPLPPPAFGTVYKFDANGLIVPTPEGITTPEGVFLVAGKPPRVPPARPADLAPADLAPAEADAPVTAPAAGDDQTQAFPADPALLGKRPAARPAGFAADLAADLAAASETATPDAGEAPSLAPAADSRFAGLRPLPRPATIAAVSATSASTLALVTPDGAVSPLGGLALSPRPVARPSAIASAVEAAVAAAALEPAPATATAAAPAIIDDGTVTPETEQEPELASAAPSIPTKANVAKEATTKNVLNLGKINLIGVYGTQSNRYALVRQANGRIVKVSVGDRIDGGRIAAVTATEVRYEKRGQMLVLAMPRG